MPSVTLRPITKHNLAQCLSLRPNPDQIKLIASMEKSLAQAKERTELRPFAVYDSRSRGMEDPKEPVIGFVMYELAAGVGFIERLLVDREWQAQGYGRATLKEVIRRLKLHPEVELIATSHREENINMAKLLKSLDFIPWVTPFVPEDPGEIFLRLKEAQAEE
ncbi:MAG: hypothetical protein GOMPHAMPRED_007987 [Gomphillus americanus]|uniref:N-acetyltransferase domain-containing protein n=1 Tax=Gomphillus americanus TaxID=1940652 RepID=A0A8H3EXX4_9LECA|nr:MAG: hypothetical protein GOMPHAMPRED_007987 [Gomphillus americanus]